MLSLSLIKAFGVFLFSCLVQKGIIMFLTSKTWYQNIYSLSPHANSKKVKTPSFGGVGIVLSVAVGTVLFSLFSFKVLWCISLFVSFAGVGFYDDSLSLFFDQNKGLTAKRKFCIQVVVAMFFLAVFSLYIRQLSWWQYGMYLFLSNQLKYHRPRCICLSNHC